MYIEQAKTILMKNNKNNLDFLPPHRTLSFFFFFLNQKKTIDIFSKKNQLLPMLHFHALWLRMPTTSTSLSPTTRASRLRCQTRRAECNHRLRRRGARAQVGRRARPLRGNRARAE